MKGGNASVKNISCKIKFIDSMKLFANLLSHFVDNLTEWVHKIRCKDCNFFLEFKSVKNSIIKYKFWSCNKHYSTKFNEELKKKFKNTFKLLTVISINLFCR